MEEPNALANTQDFEFAALNEATRYRGGLIAEFQAYLKGSVLVVGAGIGQFTEMVRAIDGVKRLVSVEPEARFCEAFRRLHPDCELVQGVIVDLPEEPAWTAILSVNVLEHIQDDAEELAQYHRRLVQARGYLCLFVPARPELYARIDQDFGHFRRYRKGQLTRMLEDAGFDLVRLHYFNAFGYFVWGLLYRVLRRRHFNPVLVRLFDRMVFPVVHAWESRFCRPPFGQSLIAIARASPGKAERADRE